MQTYIWHPNPKEVEWQLRQTDLVYPRNTRAINRGYAHIAVVPLLYEWICSQKEIPSVRKACSYLYRFRQEDLGAEWEVRQRTIKLVLDFYRELHTFGLLCTHDAFGLVVYAAATDIASGVDYIGRLSRHFFDVMPSFTEVGIQCAIGARHAFSSDGYFQSLKRRRRLSRPDTQQWDGPIYMLTNEYREPMVIPNCKVWLFTKEHVDDLVDTICVDILQDIGINVDWDVDIG